jgi:hypothetical protein
MTNCANLLKCVDSIQLRIKTNGRKVEVSARIFGRGSRNMSEKWGFGTKAVHRTENIFHATTLTQYVHCRITTKLGVNHHFMCVKACCFFGVPQRKTGKVESENSNAHYSVLRNASH